MIYLADLSGPAGVVNKTDFTSCEYVLDVSAFRATFNFCFTLFPTFLTSETTVLSFLGSLSASICSWSLEFRLRLKKFIVSVKKTKIFFGPRFSKWYINQEITRRFLFFPINLKPLDWTVGVWIGAWPRPLFKRKTEI